MVHFIMSITSPPEKNQFYVGLDLIKIYKAALIPPALLAST